MRRTHLLELLEPAALNVGVVEVPLGGLDVLDEDERLVGQRAVELGRRGLVLLHLGLLRVAVVLDAHAAPRAFAALGLVVKVVMVVELLLQLLSSVGRSARDPVLGRLARLDGVHRVEHVVGADAAIRVRVLVRGALNLANIFSCLGPGQRAHACRRTGKGKRGGGEKRCKGVGRG